MDLPLVIAAILLAATAPEITSTPALNIALEGPMAGRVDAVVEQWILTAPGANPCMLNMFRLRDRQPPYEQPVPWAGEFAGKYLISAVQLRRMYDKTVLDEHLQEFVDELIATQASDGYLGPFPKNERLRGHWDLWGHYHVMLGLYMWYQDTGDEKALNTALRAADLMCSTFLDGELRVHDAGSHEMNMAVMHVLGMLYRETGRERYLELIRQIEADWQKPPAGDYLRAAQEGLPFYQTPKPRWESLHCLQGLKELYLITGEIKYRDALVHYWRSIAETDIHNAGTFSTGEGAVGNPFMPGAIETCCTVAWMAMSSDVLRLTNDPVVADYLENALWNGMLGAIHPSGRWATYDTPMDGKRIASAQSIVFQSRPGTPELNCCSVNAPRGIGMISEWAILGNGDDIYINYYGPGEYHADFDAATWNLRQTTSYPREGNITFAVEPPTTQSAAIHFRIPAWSTKTECAINGTKVQTPVPGTYLTVERVWKAGDEVTLQFDMGIRALRGDEHVDFKTSLYRGPLLLAYDQYYEDRDPAELPQIDLETAEMERVTGNQPGIPMVRYNVNTANGESITLVDYASAGASGSAYRSWLNVTNAPPVPLTLLVPEAGATAPAVDALFQWSLGGPGTNDRLIISADSPEGPRIAAVNAGAKSEAVCPVKLEPERTYFWTVERGSETPPPQRFTVANRVQNAPIFLAPASDDSAAFSGREVTREAVTVTKDDSKGNLLNFDGENSKLTFDVHEFPTLTYTFAAWFRPDAPDPDNAEWQQIFSGWCRGSDDPLRVSVQRGRLIIQVEQPGNTYRLEGPQLAAGEWRHVAVVKNGRLIRAYLDGDPLGELRLPPGSATQSKTIGIGCNPLYEQLEGFEGAITSLLFTEKAYTENSIRDLARSE